MIKASSCFDARTVTHTSPLRADTRVQRFQRLCCGARLVALTFPLPPRLPSRSRTGRGRFPTCPPRTSRGRFPTCPPRTGRGRFPTCPPRTSRGRFPTCPPRTSRGRFLTCPRPSCVDGRVRVVGVGLHFFPAPLPLLHGERNVGELERKNVGTSSRDGRTDTVRAK